MKHIKKNFRTTDDVAAILDMAVELGCKSEAELIERALVLYANLDYGTLQRISIDLNITESQVLSIALHSIKHMDDKALYKLLGDHFSEKSKGRKKT